jgi:hypothetical protein
LAFSHAKKGTPAFSGQLSFSYLLSVKATERKIKPRENNPERSEPFGINERQSATSAAPIAATTIGEIMRAIPFQFL